MVSLLSHFIVFLNRDRSHKPEAKAWEGKQINSFEAFGVSGPNVLNLKFL